MSTHQQTKPRSANQSITLECGRPGTLRSKVGVEAIDEPCTNSTAGLPCGEPMYFSHRKRRMSPSAVFLFVQCSTPLTGLALMGGGSRFPDGWKGMKGAWHAGARRLRTRPPRGA